MSQFNVGRVRFFVVASFLLASITCFGQPQPLDPNKVVYVLPLAAAAQQQAQPAPATCPCGSVQTPGQPCCPGPLDKRITDVAEEYVRVREAGRNAAAAFAEPGGNPPIRFWNPSGSNDLMWLVLLAIVALAVWFGSRYAARPRGQQPVNGQQIQLPLTVQINPPPPVDLDLRATLRRAGRGE